MYIFSKGSLVFTIKNNVIISIMLMKEISLLFYTFFL